jgi:hypothetical protein
MWYLSMIAVQENDGLALANVYVAHLGVENCYTLSWMWIRCCHV